MSQFITSKFTSGKFSVRNISKKNQVIFNTSIVPGSVYNLLSVPGVGEQDIKDSLNNGILRNRISNGELQVVESNMVFTSGDLAVTSLLSNNGLAQNLLSAPTPSSLNQANWYIDSVNGNDANDGLTSGTALKSHAEFSRRIGIFSTVTTYDINVYLLNDLPASDPINVISRTSGYHLNYYGTTTIERTGTVTGFTGKNTATNSLAQITDHALAPGAWTADIGKRIRITTGDSAGAAAIVLGDGSDGYSSLFSDIAITLDNYFYVYTSEPSVGDTYVIERQTFAPLGYLNFQGTTTNNAYVHFYNLNFDDSAINVGGAFIPIAIGSVFFECQFPSVGFASPFNLMYNCYSAGTIATQAFGVTAFFGGLYTGIFAVEAGSSISSYNDMVLYNKAGASGIVACETGSLWLNSAMGIFNYPGGLRLMSGGCVTAGPNQGESVPGSIWGMGNDGYGITVDVGGTLAYTTGAQLTITGSSGDFLLGGSNHVRPFNDATGTYTAPVLCSWANLTPAVPTGFGGQVTNPKNAATIAIRTALNY